MPFLKRLILNGAMPPASPSQEDKAGIARENGKRLRKGEAFPHITAAEPQIRPKLNARFQL